MKKKFFALMMAMVMVLSLAACGGSAFLYDFPRIPHGRRSGESPI